MACFVTVPAEVVPLLYGGLELLVWGLDGELEEAFPTRRENPAWFEGPLGRLDRTCELLRVIDWPRSGPPVAASVDIDTWREVLLAGLDEELRALHDHRDAPGNGPELREESRRAIAAIDGFLADLPALEARAAEEAKPVVPYDDPYTAERGIVLQVLRDDHDERWSRAELAVELHDVEAQAVADALESLRREGVLHLSGDLVWASRCALRLDALGMVSI
jgi:hypothetical protein